ncbi:MAG: archease [Thermoprotei archaeon]|nr:MAG: archease [Thermoprotei archaeon]
MGYSEKIVKHGLPGKFDYLDHTADVYIVAYGSNLIELFENAGLALFDTMTDISKVQEKEERSIEVNGIDLENLLYRWIEELLTLYYSENLMCSKIIVESIEIKRSGEDIEYTLKGKCYGEQFDPERHEPKVEVKAMTYHLMRILKDEEKWRAYFVLDI